jgi:hypothetical protein
MSKGTIALFVIGGIFVVSAILSLVVMDRWDIFLFQAIVSAALLVEGNSKRKKRA